jgi:hypothetical protein
MTEHYRSDIHVYYVYWRSAANPIGSDYPESKSVIWAWTAADAVTQARVQHADEVDLKITRVEPER